MILKEFRGLLKYPPILLVQNSIDSYCEKKLARAVIYRNDLRIHVLRFWDKLSFKILNHLIIEFDKSFYDRVILSNAFSSFALEAIVSMRI